jgi:hypothetical protein
LGSVSGSANLKAVINGMKNYFDFLREMSKQNDELSYIVKLRWLGHAIQRCQIYYCFLHLNIAPLGAEYQQEIVSIREFQNEDANGAVLDERCCHFFGRMKLRMRKWIVRN